MPQNWSVTQKFGKGRIYVSPSKSPPATQERAKNNLTSQTTFPLLKRKEQKEQKVPFIPFVP
jgi:hypothetical protein